MNKWLIALALLLVTTAAGMAGIRWQQRRVAASRVNPVSCVRTVSLAMQIYARNLPTTAPAAAVEVAATTQPATQPTSRWPVIVGCSKNHDMEGQNVLYADGSLEFQARPLTNDTYFSATTLPAPDLWDMLQQGGYVIVFRHAKTVGSGKDPDGFKLVDRATQRNLSDEGIAQAKAIGQRFRDRKIPVGRVLSSEYYRCRETAELAFGQVTAEPVLNSLEDEQQAERLRKLLETRPATGNTVLVTHQANLKATAGLIPEMGDAVVVQPMSDGSFRVLGVLRTGE